MQTNRSWYVVYTKTGSEKKVADLLSRKKIVSYCPTCNQEKVLNGKLKASNVSLFTNMVFAYATEQDHAVIKKIEGVSGILFWLQKPAIVGESEIESIRFFLQQHNDVCLEKIKVLKEDGSAIANSGVASRGDYHTVGIDGVQKIYLPSLGFALATVSTTARIKSVA